jgi:hypothetical protein
VKVVVQIGMVSVWYAAGEVDIPHEGQDTIAENEGSAFVAGNIRWSDHLRRGQETMPTQAGFHRQ